MSGSSVPLAERSMRTNQPAETAVAARPDSLKPILLQIEHDARLRLSQEPWGASPRSQVSAEVTGEEPERAVGLERWQVAMPAGIGVQRLLG